MELLKKCLLPLAAVVLASSVVFAQESVSMQAAFAESYLLESKGDFTNAIAAVKKSGADSSYEFNLRLGWLSYLSGKLTESVGYYQKAIDLKSDSIEAKFGCIYPMAALGHWDQVIDQYKDILKVDEGQVTANYRLGLIYYNRADFKKAEKCFQKVVNLYPMDYDSTIMLAWTCFKLKKADDAKMLANQALVLRPKNVSALQLLGLIK